MVSELRNLTKPAKVIAVVLAVLFAVSGFLARDSYQRVTGSSSDALAAVARLEKDKLGRTEYKQDCAIIRSELDKKADRDKVETLQRRTDQVLTVLLEPAKREAVRSQFEQEKAKR